MIEDGLRREATMMNIDGLIRDRETIENVAFAAPAEELLDRYEALYTGLISDVLREHCLLNQALPGHILPLRPERSVAGFAFTVKSAPNVLISGEMDTRTRMLNEMTPHAFVMWDASGDARATRGRRCGAAS